MNVRQFQKNRIVIDFSEDDKRAYVAIAKTQDLTLRHFVHNAVVAYYKLIRDIKKD